MSKGKGDLRFRKKKGERYRFVKIYYRDEDGTFRAIPGLRIQLDGKIPLEVYTLNAPIKSLDVRNLRE